MKNIAVFFFFGLLTVACVKTHRTEPFQEIQLARDQWGVPHIIAPTDAKVAYGLAWAQCEDDFVTLQEQMLAVRGKLGTVKGKDGVIADFALKFMQLREVAIQNYEQQLSEKMIDIIAHFVSGVNTYATLHPEEVLNDDIFPLEVPDLIVGYMLALVEISGAGNDLKKIMDGSIVKYLNPDATKGSNAIAVSPLRTHEDESFLAINSHQPLEGWYSWYEAHLISDQGMNILGGTFPGGVNIFHGINENLGWAHTVNGADFSDVFQLKMHPKDKLLYALDGEWKKLEKKHIWCWVKIAGPLCIPIRKTIYESAFGTTFKTDHGFFAWRFQAQNAVGAVEQWYEMNKARSYSEFREALELRAIPCTNIVYADKNHNIFCISNGSFPGRKTGIDWTKVIPGNSSEVLYTDAVIPLDSLPQTLNPQCGYVFNTNNTPYSNTCSVENPKMKPHQSLTSYLPSGTENLRSRRFLELIAQYDTLTYEDFKRIKYDQTYPSNMSTPAASNLEGIFSLDPIENPEIADALYLLRDWDRSTTADSEVALLFIKIYNQISKTLSAARPLDPNNALTLDQMVQGITLAKQEMLTKYGTMKIRLGDVQRHSRGTKDLAIGGGPDILPAVYTKERADGKERNHVGDSYILLARFPGTGLPIVETIHCYGSSAEPESVHYNDQMDMFVRQELKPMSLDREVVLANADTIYHPLIVLN